MVSSDASPSCPTGFVIPDDPSDPDNLYVNRTISDCAVSCQYPNYSKAEWEYFDSTAKYALYIGLFMISVTIFVLFRDNEKNPQPMARLICILSLLSTLNDILFFNFPWDERLCRNNAIMLDASDGFTLCAFDSVFNMFGGLSILVCWVLQSFIVFSKIVLGRSSFRSQITESILRLTSIALVVAPIVALIATDSYGALLGSSRCFFGTKAFQNNFNLIFWSEYFSLLIIGSVMMIAVVWKAVSVLDPCRLRVRIDPGHDKYVISEVPHHNSVNDNNDNSMPDGCMSRRIGEDSEGESIDLEEPDIYSASRKPLSIIYEASCDENKESEFERFPITLYTSETAELPENSDLPEHAERWGQSESEQDKNSNSNSSDSDRDDVDNKLYDVSYTTNASASSVSSSAVVKAQHIVWDDEEVAPFTITLKPSADARMSASKPIPEASVPAFVSATQQVPYMGADMLRALAVARSQSNQRSIDSTSYEDIDDRIQSFSYSSSSKNNSANSMPSVEMIENHLDDFDHGILTLSVQSDSLSERQSASISMRSVSDVAVSSEVMATRARLSMLKKLRLLAVPVCFVLFYALDYGTILVQVSLTIANGPAWHTSFVEWSQCAIVNYDGITDESWHNICGSHPAERMSVTTKAAFNVFFAGQSIFIAMVYSPGVWHYLVLQYKKILGYETLDNLSV